MILTLKFVILQELPQLQTCGGETISAYHAMGGHNPLSGFLHQRVPYVRIPCNTAAANSKFVRLLGLTLKLIVSIINKVVEIGIFH